MGIARHQAIHLIDRDTALVMVLEDQFSGASAGGQGSVEVELDLAPSFLHLVHSRKTYGEQLGREPASVD